MSADDQLSETGTVTGIKWAEDHEKYVKYLTSGLEERRASVLKIFRIWDDIFFPGRGPGLGGRPTEEDSTADAMDALRADDEEEEPHLEEEQNGEQNGGED